MRVPAPLTREESKRASRLAVKLTGGWISRKGSTTDFHSDEEETMEHLAYTVAALCRDYMQGFPHEDVVASDLRDDMEEIVAYPPEVDGPAQTVAW